MSGPTQYLPTVKVRTVNGTVLRFLLDTGSNVNLIAYRTAKMLNLIRRQSDGAATDNITLHTVDSTSKVPNTPIVVNVKLQNSSIPITFYLVPEIKPIAGEDPQLTKPIRGLSDPFPRKWPLQLDGILSISSTLKVADKTLVPVQHAKGLYVWKTVFGHALLGQLTDEQPWEYPIRSTFLTATERLSLVTERFMQMSNIPEDHLNQNMTEAEKLAVELLQTTLTFSEEQKRFTCKLLFKQDAKPINNYKNAIARLHKIWDHLSKNEDKRVAYKNAIDKLIADGHVTELSVDEAKKNENNAMYLPHSIVHSPSSLTTPYRLVFDGSAILSTQPKIRYNDLLLPGPALHRNLTALLIRFRQRRFVLNGDIKALFLNVLLHKDHQDFCRFLWKEDVNQPVKVLRFSVLLFGLNCSPAIAMAAVQRLTKMVLENPESTNAERLAAERLTEDIYVDDLVTTFDDLDTLQECYSAISSILSRASFTMRKFMSNSLEWMATVPEEVRLPNIVEGHRSLPQIPDPTVRAFPDLEKDDPGLDLHAPQDSNIVSIGASGLEDLHGPKTSTTTLGYRYNIKDDKILFDQYSKLHEIPEEPTMRTLASKLAKIYDPLGLVSAFILVARILLRKCHENGYSWTTKLPQDEEIFLGFKQWLEASKQLEKISYPRHAPFDQDSHFAICADACKDGIACTVHAISRGKKKSVSNLLFAKALIVNQKMRQRPMAAIELSALRLAADVALSLVENLRIRKDQITLHTDSMVTAFWLQKKSFELKPYIAARVRFIQDSGFKVRHIEGTQNPSDLYSRGIANPTKLMDPLLLHGPSYFTKPIDTWPVTPADKANLDQTAFDEGLKPSNVIISSNYVAAQMLERKVKHNGNFHHYSFFDYYSSYRKMVRITARLFMCVDIFKQKKKDRSGWPTHISPEYWNKAENLLIRKVQELYFAQELTALKANRNLPTRSPIAKFQGFIDGQGVLRAKGRMVFDDIMNAERMPIILPSSKFTLLLIKHIHDSNYHAVKNAIQQILNEKYVIVKGNQQVDKVIRACVICQRYNNKRFAEKMAPIPEFIQNAAKTNESQSFMYVAADYSSKFKVKTYMFAPPDIGKNQKGANVLDPPKKKRGRPKKEVTSQETPQTNDAKSHSAAYMVIYLDLYSRAIHIELVASEDAQEQFRALIRLIAARGCPKVLVTDKASNFIEATKRLNGYHKKWQEVLQMAADKAYYIEHKTYTGLGGGSHQSPAERYIGLVKHSILKSIKGAEMTFSQLYTICKEIEIAHNSRMISATTSLNPIGITPIQLVLGRKYQPLIDLMPVVFKDKKDFNLRWTEMNGIMKTFHKIWKSEYFPFIQQMTKWTQPECRVLKKDALVLVYDEKIKPYNYKLARVVSVNVGRDNRVRNIALTWHDDNEVFERHASGVIPLNIDLFQDELRAIERSLAKRVESNRQLLKLTPLDSNDQSQAQGSNSAPDAPSPTR